MPPAPRKIVFHMPSLVTEAPTRSGSREVAPESGGDGRADPLPASGAEATPAGGDVRKLATLLEVSQALAGTLNLQTGLYGVLEVLERRCGAGRGAVTLIEEASGLLVVEAALGYPPDRGPGALPGGRGDHRRASPSGARRRWCRT